MLIQPFSGNGGEYINVTEVELCLNKIFIGETFVKIDTQRMHGELVIQRSPLIPNCYQLWYFLNFLIKRKLFISKTLAYTPLPVPWNP